MSAQKYRFYSSQGKGGGTLSCCERVLHNTCGQFHYVPGTLIRNLFNHVVAPLERTEREGSEGEEAENWWGKSFSIDKWIRRE